MNMRTDYTSIAKSATEYAARGWHVFPVPPGEKKSYKSEKHCGGQKWGATTDQGVIARDWQKWPSANVGIVTGPKSGFFVIEADTPQGHKTDGVSNLFSLIDANGTLPETVEALSPTGSWHLYFKWPEGINIRNSAGQVAPGVDVRADGGMVLGVPSVRPGFDQRYRWKNPPGLFELAECPDWLLKLVLKPEKEKAEPRQSLNADIDNRWAQAALQSELAALLATPVGGRNHQLFKSASALFEVVSGGHLGEALVRERLEAAASAIGLDSLETWRTIDSGFKAGIEKPRGPKQRKENTEPKFRHSELSLVRDDKGRPFFNPANALTLLSQHPEWSGVLAYNGFTAQKYLLRPIPGQKAGISPRPLEDDDYVAVQCWFNRNGFPRTSMDIVQGAVRKTCRDNHFDPLQDYLNNLIWDGEERLNTWLSAYCGAEPSVFSSEAGKRWCISAVARGLSPGCKADHMLVLEGSQGQKKSTALATLTGVDWFSDALPAMGTKDASSFLRGKWVIEVGELEAMRREVDAVKAFISRQVETFRPAYGREEVSEPRRCVFAGTTNKEDWQRDETGGRRFWPVRVGEIDINAIARDRDQIWAEAVELYRQGERWWLEGEAEKIARKEVSNRRPVDPWSEDICKAVHGYTEVTAKQVLSKMGVKRADMTPLLAKRVAQELVAQGWKRAGRITSGEGKGAVRFVPDAKSMKAE